MDEVRLLALEFDTNSLEFARGFEAGRLWEQLKDGSEPVDQNVMAQNAEMMLRLAEATGRAVRSVELGHDRMHVTFLEAP
jgi:hypothetical protein